MRMKRLQTMIVTAHCLGPLVLAMIGTDIMYILSGL